MRELAENTKQKNQVSNNSRINAQEIKDACEKFFERRGQKKVSFRDMVNENAKKGVRKNLAQKRVEEAAQELEHED